MTVVLTSAERPELPDRPELESVWPEYNTHGETTNRFWGRLYEEFPEFQFVLYDASGGGSPIGPLLQRINVPVSGGLFTVSLDFGTGAFAGSARWLEVGVRPGGTSGTFTILVPRQEVTPAPG